MSLQERAVCLECHDQIEHSPVFAAPCGHEGCPSAVFHGICLMEYREKVARAKAAGMPQVVGFILASPDHVEDGSDDDD